MNTKKFNLCLDGAILSVVTEILCILFYFIYGTLFLIITAAILFGVFLTFAIIICRTPEEKRKGLILYLGPIGYLLFKILVNHDEKKENKDSNTENQKIPVDAQKENKNTNSESTKIPVELNNNTENQKIPIEVEKGNENTNTEDIKIPVELKGNVIKWMTYAITFLDFILLTTIVIVSSIPETS